ncbi:hypothetical protein VQ02_12465 [Methylobacterium variabile]|uniref:Uncharacterized protein n=2 Tax=Methylobacterium TaxID=407 RepID=A0A0J6SVZ9_9HYPH|nr:MULTISPECIES: hypothetical protein [Methylobacterium]KMO23404.1 hypothetical protein VP06_33565 [Methylobacterium aquaticum]KMO37894.1 hypothetical protein VQ02_12465 [Methylobacterium variabile]
MRAFRLHRGWREPNGVVTDHATLERVIKATSASEAMSAALAEGDFLLTEDANLVWLTDDQGTLVWSLHLYDENTALNP